VFSLVVETRKLLEFYEIIMNLKGRLQIGEECQRRRQSMSFVGNSLRATAKEIHSHT
jgi:hypothetical protein